MFNSSVNNCGICNINIVVSNLNKCNCLYVIVKPLTVIIRTNPASNNLMNPDTLSYTLKFITY